MAYPITRLGEMSGGSWSSGTLCFILGMVTMVVLLILGIYALFSGGSSSPPDDNQDNFTPNLSGDTSLTDQLADQKLRWLQKTTTTPNM